MNSEENKAEEIKEETEIPEETTENEAVENKEEAAEEKKETSDKKGLFKNKNAKYEKEIEELGQKACRGSTDSKEHWPNLTTSENVL